MRGKRIPKDDVTIVEISNDVGDHLVFEVPTSQKKEVEKIMRGAGVRRDTDEAMMRTNSLMARRIIDNRDHQELRYTYDRIVDEGEDLEPEVDDDSILEPDEVPVECGMRG